MVQGYYTLQEAAQVLGMPPDELKQMAQKNQIRSFQDRGTWRFRVQDIQELARQRGAASDQFINIILIEDAAKLHPRAPGCRSLNSQRQGKHHMRREGGPALCADTLLARRFRC